MLKLARVVDVHPESHSVDLLIMDDNRRVTGVPVLSHSASSSSGFAGLTEPDSTGYDSTASGSRDVYAVVGFSGYTPIVLGFMYPQVAQCLFPDGRMVYRHESDVYVTIDKTGNVEVVHPSGAFFKIGDGTDKTDLSGKDYDKIWSIKKNTSAKVNIRAEIPGAVSFNFSPDGNVDVKAKGPVVVQSDKTATVKAEKVAIQAPVTTMSGSLTVDGLITGKTGIALSGGSGGVAGVIHGTIKVVDGDVIADEISLKEHLHRGVQPGGGVTGKPTAEGGAEASA